MKRTLLFIPLLVATSASAKPKKHPTKPAVTTPAAPSTPAAPPANSPAPAEPAPEAQNGNAPAPDAATHDQPPPAPAPAAPTAPPAPSAPTAAKGDKPPAVDLESLNNEYNALRDELFRSRAKAELLGAALFKTRLVATFQYKAQRAWPLKKVTLRLDDQPVYSADAPSASDDPVKIYEGTLAPGRHALTVRVECGAVGESRLGYATEDTFQLDAADGKQARIELTVDEVGDGPQPLAKKKAGDVDVRVKARVRSLELDAK